MSLNLLLIRVHHSFERDKCPKDLNEVPDFMSLSQFQLRPEKQIESMFTQIVRDDGFVYADDLLEMVGNMKLTDKLLLNFVI